MNKIVLLPLESLESRYTSQWAKWWPAQLQKDGTNFITIEGKSLTSKIEVGSVLDAYSTNYYKFTQMANLIEKIRNGEVGSSEVLIFHDLWFPGIEALRYISNLGGARPKITGILHAGTYDDHDFLVRNGLRPYFHEIESAWMKIYDCIFVATEFHKNLILKSHSVDPNKIVVTGLPFYPDDFVTERRKKMVKTYNSIVFPHRLDPEKHPEKFDSLFVNDSEQLSYAHFKTAGQFNTKSEYYDELARSEMAVSFADQETFGYAMLEATALGCYPLVPDRLSYQEMYPRECRYQTHEELIEKIKRPKNKDVVYEIASKHKARYTQSITNMTQVISTRFNS